MPTRTTGAARYWVETQLGSPTREKESNPNIQTTPTTVVQSNPDRVGLIMVNMGANDVFIGVTNSVSTTNGIRVVANGGNVTMTVRDDFTLPAREWDGVGSGGASLMYVLEEVADINLAPEQQ
jgi:hypothetical protein